jgi:hypothetical protein
VATTNLYFNDQTQYGRMLRRGLNLLEEGYELLNDVLANVPHMIDGNGSDAAHFTEVTARYGFDNNADAKAAWDELNSLMFKLNTNTSVSDMNAAMLQAFAKLR